MHRKAIWVVGWSLGVVGIAAAAYLSLEPPRPATVTLLFPRDSSDAVLWPTDGSWIWSVKLPESAGNGRTLSVLARVVHEALPKGQSPAIGPRVISRAECETEIAAGTLTFVKSAREAVVSVQTIDLAEVALPSGTQPLRMRVGLRVGGSTVWRSGVQSVIDGERFLGQALVDMKDWMDNELHLQTLFVLVGERVATYDILVRLE